VKNDLCKVLVDLKSFNDFKISNAIKIFNDAKNVCRAFYYVAHGKINVCRAFLCCGARQSPLETGPNSPACCEPSIAI
jgi:hypothetical protein